MMKSTALKPYNGFMFHCITKGLMLFVFLVLIAAGVQAQTVSITTIDAQNQEGVSYPALQVNNPSAFSWYVLYKLNADGTYEKLQSLASDGTSFSFSVKLEASMTYQVYTYSSNQELPLNAPKPQDHLVGQVRADN